MKVKNLNKFKTKIDENGRVCTTCGVYRLWIDFKGHSRSATGHSSQCKACYKQKRRSKGRKRELYSAKNRNEYLRIHEPIVWKSRILRSRLLQAEKKNSPNSKKIPTAKDLQKWFEEQFPLHCYYTNEALSIYDINVDHKQPLTRGGTNDIDNLCVTSSHLNSAKGKMNEKEFKELLELISTWEDSGASLLSRLKQGWAAR